MIFTDDEDIMIATKVERGDRLHAMARMREAGDIFANRKKMQLADARKAALRRARF